MINFMIFGLILFAVAVLVYRLAGKYTGLAWKDIWALDNLKYLPILFLIGVVIVKPTIVNPGIGLFSTIYTWATDGFALITNADPWWGLVIATSVFLGFTLASYILIVRGLSFITVLDQERVKLTARLITAAIFSACGLHLLKGSVELILYVQIVSSISFAILIVTIIANWRSKVQDKLGLPFAYVSNIFMIWALAWIVSGLDIFRNITGSLVMALPFILFNVAVIVVIDKFLAAEKPDKEKFAWKLNYINTFALSLAFLWLSGLMLIGYIDRFNLKLAHTNNRAEATRVDLDKRIALSIIIDGMNYDELLVKLDKILSKNDRDKTKNDRDEIARLQKINTKFSEELSKVEKPKYILLAFGSTYEAYEDLKGLTWGKTTEPTSSSDGPKAKARTADYITPAPGKTLSFTVEPGKPYRIDKMTIKKGQEFTFLTYNAPIEFRVKDDESSCWEKVKNNLPWRALVSGELQIRAGNIPANVTLNIKT